jgi:hypothetical protein
MEHHNAPCCSVNKFIIAGSDKCHDITFVSSHAAHYQSREVIQEDFEQEVVGKAAVQGVFWES